MTVSVGDEIPILTKEPITRTTLALFAGGSGDHNPIHIDLDVARAAGMPDVFAQGMLPMAYLGQALTDWRPQSTLREFSTRFVAITNLGEEISCHGRVTALDEIDGEQLVRLEIKAVSASGETKLLGEALVALG